MSGAGSIVQEVTSAEYLSVEEVDRIYNLQRRLLDRLTADGLLPYYKLGKGRSAPRRFRRRDILRYLDSCRIEASA